MACQGWGIPPEPAWGGDEEVVPYVTYRFSHGDDGRGAQSLQVAQLTGVTAVGKNSR